MENNKSKYGSKPIRTEKTGNLKQDDIVKKVKDSMKKTEKELFIELGKSIFEQENPMFSKDWCKVMIYHLTEAERQVSDDDWRVSNEYLKEKLQEFVDGKIIMTPELERLVNEWKQHGCIIILFGYDDTVHPWRLYNEKQCNKVIKLLIDCKDVGAFTVCNTPCNKDRYPEIRDYLNLRGLLVNSINENPIELPYGNNARPYANVILDNRAGLNEAMELLENAMVLMRSYRLSKNTNFEL